MIGKMDMLMGSNSAIFISVWLLLKDGLCPSSFIEKLNSWKRRLETLKVCEYFSMVWFGNIK